MQTKMLIRHHTREIHNNYVNCHIGSHTSNLKKRYVGLRIIFGAFNSKGHQSYDERCSCENSGAASR